MAVGHTKDEWKYADIHTPGAQYVILAGAAMMLVLYADSWDLHTKVQSCSVKLCHCID